MRSIFQLESPALKQYAAVGILFLLLAAVVIGKALLLDNCMAYDSSDDLNHTFTGLFTAKKLLSNGAMPYFNFYNNFGTPLMGDAVTYPFAIQALPFYFTDINNYPLVATVNKFVLCFATLTSLLLFYRTFNISIFASAIAAICVFFNFGFFWHFAHHHYQATVLFAATIFIVQRVFIRNNSYKLLFFSVAIISAAMIYSVSANLILLSFIFFSLHPLFYQKPAKAIVVNALALFAGGVLGSIQIITTVLAMMNTVRSSKSYVDAFYLKFSSLDLILRALFQKEFAGVHIGHVYVAAYFPMIIVLSYIVGMYIFYKNKNYSTLALSLGLGLLPVLVTGFLLVNTWLLKAIPLLKSTDITRILWIAMIFIGIGIGNFTEAIQTRAITRKISWIMAIVMTLSLCLCTIFVLTNKTTAIIALGYGAACILMIAYLLQGYVTGGLNNSRRQYVMGKWPLISGVIVLLAITCTYWPVVHILGGWRSPELCRSVNYFNGIPAFDQYLGRQVGRLSETARFAMKSDSSKGIELVGETFDRHGAGARSISMDGKLQGILLAKGVIEVDARLSAYHFTAPWDNSISSLLGLRYFGTRNVEQHDNWIFIDQWGDFFIYENERKPSLVYFRDEQNNLTFINTFRIKGNDMYVDIPRTINGGKLHVTITARPGFSVYVDEKRHAFGADDFGFICADVTPANKIMRVSYQPLDFYWLLKK
jgi:hypothetical protein